MSKVSNESLLMAGIEAMKKSGKSLERVHTGNRSMIFRLNNGETVRVRTCNDHVLVVLADSSESDAGLNIDGTDHLLIVMPQVPRTEGPVYVYFVPTDVASAAARQTHADWLASNPSTRGNNRTWNIFFDEGPAMCGGFAQKWDQYRMDTTASTLPEMSANVREGVGQIKPLGAVIAEARKAIAEAAGVPIEAVKISVELD